MITNTYPNPNPVVPKSTYLAPVSNAKWNAKTDNKTRPNNDDIKKAKHFNIDPEEFVRRDLIACKLSFLVPYKVGEVVIPVDAKKQVEYGDILVKEIMKSYHDFTYNQAKDWPKNDNPFLVLGEYTDVNGEIQQVHFTTNFVKRKEICKC